MTENDYMPFGTYGPDKGDHRKLKDIPAGYLVWLYECEFAWVEENHPEVYDYIEENLEQLESELKTREPIGRVTDYATPDPKVKGANAIFMVLKPKERKKDD